MRLLRLFVVASLGLAACPPCGDRPAEPSHACCEGQEQPGMPMGDAACCVANPGVPAPAAIAVEKTAFVAAVLPSAAESALEPAFAVPPQELAAPPPGGPPSSLRSRAPPLA